ncbi:hypothetical protein PV10_05461 [Exophiala mesophila]|uniref:Zn(2)-C6 fungal-type domain-containing protein n=1 Tax=Exophiala mesophila TaxID=212818 RepID=A0A0D1WP72_EXOME|nr:uncharacterized protein PV10_05461 [Exophiala mesophila]KIV90855.1 hypothetical protein PV10_05461 [Exophiala mesophila]
MACNECRQQKVKCDRHEVFPNSCSRCRRAGVQCVYSKHFRRQRRPKISELQSQIESLQKRLSGSPGDASVPDQVHEAILPPATLMAPITTITQTSSAPLQGQKSAKGTPQTSTSPSVPVPIDHEPVRSFISTAPPMQRTLPQSIDELRVTAWDIDQCFAIFKQHCMTYVPMIETLMDPNECHRRSALLFWTIVAVGSRKYSENPTLIILLGPKVSNLAKLSLFAQEPVLLNIQAYLLLCSWPMPFEALSNDITPILAGVVLQLATTIGLHVSGVGQEFARDRVSPDLTYRVERGRLWTACVIVSQRIVTVNGTPPLVIPDTYGDDSKELIPFVTPSLHFQKQVSQFLSMTILYIQNHALHKPGDVLPHILDPIISSAVDRLVILEADATEPLDRFYALSAQLHLLNFHLFKRRTTIADATLLAMHDLACRTVELAIDVDSTLQMAEYGPVYITKFLHSAAITLLRLKRSAIAPRSDLGRGQRAFFAVINYHKRHAVRPDDAFARFSIILTQLWSSTNIFQYSDGVVDSLRVRSKARLGMSMVYDCFWWWRQEFGGQSSVYGDHNADDNANFNLDHFTPFWDNNNLDLINLDSAGPIPDLEWPLFDKFCTESWPSIDLCTIMPRQ